MTNFHEPNFSNEDNGLGNHEAAHITGAEVVDPWDKITQENFSMLRGSEYEDVLHSESFGGNAGFDELFGQKVSCAGVNGYADPESGRIVAFGNSQNLDNATVNNNQLFTLRVGLFMPAGDTRIMSVHLRELLPETAKRRLIDAAILKNLDLEAEEQARHRLMVGANTGGIVLKECIATETTSYTLYRSRPVLGIAKLFRR